MEPAIGRDCMASKQTMICGGRDCMASKQTMICDLQPTAVKIFEPKLLLKLLLDRTILDNLIRDLRRVYLSPETF